MTQRTALEIADKYSDDWTVSPEIIAMLRHQHAEIERLTAALEHIAKGNFWSRFAVIDYATEALSVSIKLEDK